jgi:acyl-CoA dehydrogenase
MSATIAKNAAKPRFTQIIEDVHEIGKSVISRCADDVDRDARFPEEAFRALSDARLLSAYVPGEYGGLGLNIKEICGICETLGEYCASTAMIFAMHQIQVACLVHHGRNQPFFDSYLRELVDEQRLLASATTEIGIGGDVRSSICAVAVRDGRYSVRKKAPVISYAEDADAILTTCRSSEDAPRNDQSIVLVKKEDCTLEQIAGWDTLGFRGTCSCGYILDASGNSDQIMPIPYAQILAKTMHPVSHLVWASLWTGLASDAVEKARQTVREAARKSPQVPPVSALRLSEVNEVLFSMRAGLYRAIDEYQDLLDAGDDKKLETFGFAIRTNNVKIRSSEMVVDIVGKALQIVGISGYKNDSKKSLSRHLRDAYGASLMVNNDRIRGHNASMQIAHKGR